MPETTPTLENFKCVLAHLECRRAECKAHIDRLSRSADQFEQGRNVIDNEIAELDGQQTIREEFLEAQRWLLQESVDRFDNAILNYDRELRIINHQIISTNAAILDLEGFDD